MTKRARYNLASITTTDINILERRNNVKSSGVTDEQIYIKGIEFIEKENKKIFS